MSVHQTDAVTIRTYRYSEAHKIAVFYTKDWGIVRGVVYGAEGRHSPFRAALDTLAQVRLTFRIREAQDLATIQNCEIIRHFAVHELSWEESLHFSYFAELLFEFGQEHGANERLYRLIVAAIEAAGKVAVRDLARYFEFWLLRLEGVLPALEGRLDAALAAKVRDMLGRHPTRLQGGLLSQAETDRLARLTRGLIEGHLEKGLKTARLLDQL